MKQTIAVAISGGIDSLVAASILKERGHEVIGIHFFTGYEADPLYNSGGKFITQLVHPKTMTSGKAYSHPISHIAEQLDIPIKILDCRTGFRKTIVDYFITTYLSGRTPNPCLLCNPSIKFGTVLDSARKLGISRLATGHFSRTAQDKNGRIHLLKGVDPAKDQSYFLAFLSQNQLAGACFPLGGMTKPEVIKLAEAKGLTPIIKQESQDICFTRGKTYGEFLKLQSEFEPKTGRIEDINGNILGEHQGLHLFTIGQRQGINCPASEPYYVIRMDVEKNRLIVGFKKNLMASECKIVRINWINPTSAFPIKVFTRIRYRHRAVSSTLFPIDRHSSIVRFETPQMAVTPGQGAVFYHEDEVLGGGWIEN